MEVFHSHLAGPEFANDPDDEAPVDGTWWDAAHSVTPHSVTAEDLAPDVLAGITGPVGMTWRGDWSAGASYAANDVVFSAGSSYICTMVHAGHEPPDASYWQNIADRGATWWSGDGVPTLVVGSKAGDYYLDRNSGIVYQLT